MPSLRDFSIVDINIMTELRDLGKGASAHVRLMLWVNRKVAVKRSTCENPVRGRKRLEKEATVHERINTFSNVVRFLGRAVETDESGEEQIVGIIMEWCPLGDLFKAISNAASVQEHELDGEDISTKKDAVGFHLYKDCGKRLQAITDIAVGMASMHSRNFVHRDLTSWNVLLKSTGYCGEYEINICDFERGCYLSNGESIKRTKACANSAPWMGPEVLNHEMYDLKADVYSIGTILWELILLENPWIHPSKKYSSANIPTIHYMLLEGKISLSISEADAPGGISEFPKLVQLVNRAWASVPGGRPTMAEFYREVMEICTRMKEQLPAEEAKCVRLIARS